MAKQCAICGKTGRMVWRLKKLRGKYHRTIKKRKKPNLQWVKIPIGIKRKNFKQFAGKKVLACTKCIKTLGKRK